MLDTAHGYARRGWSVLPLHRVDNAGTCSCIYGQLCPEQSKGKHPRWAKWTARERMSSPDIQAYWDENPLDNVGIRTGAPSGFFVLDIDPKNGGMESWEELLAMHAYDFPETYTVVTGSGGLHLYLLMPSFDVTNSAKGLPSGIDVRGTGGLVVAPPSASGIGAYRLLNDLDLAQAPAWLLALLQAGAGQVDTSTVAQEDLPAFADLDEDDRDRLATYTAQALTAAVSEYESAGQGTGDGALFRAACSALELAQSPWNLTTAADVHALLDAARGRRNVRAAAWSGGQSDPDFARIWGSARSRTAGRGRAVPPDPHAGVYFDPFPLAPGAPVPGAKTAPELGPDGIQTIIRPEQTDPFPALDWTEMFGRDWGAIDWMLGKFVERGQQMALIGDGKAGKSLFAFEWVWRLAAGTGFLGDDGGRPLRVLYVDRENSQDDLYRRAVALGATPEQLAGVSYLSFPPFKPLDVDGAEQFMEQVARRRPDVVVLDTVSRFVGGKENDAETWLNLYRMVHAQLKRDGITGVRLDHFGKDAEKGGRGSSAKSQDIDHVWELTAASAIKRPEDDHLTVTTALTLRRTHTRSGRGTDQFSITRTGWKDTADEDWLPGRTAHTLAGGSTAGVWLAAQAVALALDEAGAPVNISRERARPVLKRLGVPFDNNVTWSDVKRYRGTPPPPVDFVPIPMSD